MGAKLNVSVQQADEERSAELGFKSYPGCNNADNLSLHLLVSDVKIQRVRRNRERDEGESAGEVEHTVLCSGTAAEPSLGCGPFRTPHRDARRRIIYESAHLCFGN